MEIEKHWKLEKVDPFKFIQYLDLLIDDDTVLLFEGMDISEEARFLFDNYKSDSNLKPLRDTSGETELFFVNWSKELQNNLIKLLREKDISEICYHFKGFKSGLLIFWYHDADCKCDDPVISTCIVEDKLKIFVKRIDAQYILVKSNFDWGKSFIDS